ncbi:MAG: hypothetical protein AAF989_02515 [Planctomycetota bacterium]
MPEHRLAPLHLLPPPTGQAWQGVRQPESKVGMKRADGSTLSIPAPLFWYTPDWYTIPVEHAGLLAAAVAKQGITVAALGSETGQSCDDWSSLMKGLPRLIPYRPERYGLHVRDFDDASVIDLRLTLARDPSGRFAFPPAQAARWEHSSGHSTIAGGGWVQAASFPPDVPDLLHLGSKLAQLRQLSPSAAVFVSINPIDLKSELQTILEADPDGVILRLDRYPMSGLQLASIVSKTRGLIDRFHSADLPLWLVPGPVSADDAAKLLAIGASAIAMDPWCEEILRYDFDQPLSAAERLGLSGASHDLTSEHVEQVVSDCLGEIIDRFSGLHSSVNGDSIAQRLGTFDQEWAEQLDVRKLG